MRVPKILICGSINMDLVVLTPHLPLPGETRLARAISEVSGGKGANQAVAAARLGAKVSLLGRVGNDSFGGKLRKHLSDESIDVSHVMETKGPSGIAIVAVEDSGENSILVIPGANALLTADDVDRAAQLFGDCDALVVQLETPIETIVQAMQTAKGLGKRTILNPAPAPAAFDSRLYDVDVLCPNRSEASAMLGMPITDRQAALDALPKLLSRGPRAVVITLGSDGAVVGDASGVEWIPPYLVQPKDTTAAGDAFVGALAYQLCLGRSLVEAATFAAAAGAYAATIAGAQPSMPNLNQIADLIRSSARGT